MANAPIGPPGTIVSSQSSLVLPVLSKATDLPSALHTINALIQYVQILTNAIPSQASSASSASSGSSSTAPVVSTFQQTALQTKTIRVTDPNDSSVFVDVEQITGLTMYDPVTKQTWEWHQ